MVATVLPVKRGISSPAVTNIPKEWDRQWFRYFIDNFLAGGDIRNAATVGLVVTGSVSGSPTSITTAAAAPIPNNTVLGNISGATAVPVALSKAQLTALINTFTNSTAGAVPASGGGTINFLRADGQFVPPVSVKTVNKGAAWISPSGALISATANLVFVNCPVAGTIKSAKILTAGGTGSCVVDVWKAPFVSFPPTVANTITAAALPTITSGISSSDSTLTGWTTSINVGDVLAFKLNSSSIFTQIEVILEIQ